MRAHRNLNSKQSLGIHFGVFQLTWETIDQPLIDLEDALREQQVPQNAFWILEPGGWRTVMSPDQ
ncbi:hypothetical protein N8723_05180 [Luminiphilus sp.]|nr:hypothetical protein [Luminiphilus sp.]